jgi:hypothetical protein
VSTSFADLVRSTIAGKYFLKSVAAEHGEVATFIADGPDGSPVHVRLAAAGSSAADSWESIAAASAAVSHRNLLRYYDAGDCSIDGQPYVYLAHEFVQDRVEDALSKRALTTEEADMVTRAALAGLGALHAKNYFHGDVRPGAVVAASDEVKLTGEHTLPLPGDEAEARRAISADLMGLGETVTELLMREHGPGAAARLPSPFAEFVRATAGTSGCPHPTAEQLASVLDGRDLETVAVAAAAAPAPPPPAAPAPVPAAAPPVRPVPAVSGPQSSPKVPAAPPTMPPPPAERPVFRESVPSALEDERRQAGRRNTTILLAVFGALVLALVVWLSRRAPKAEPAAAVPAPVVTPAPAPAPAAKAPAVESGTHWYVIAAVYGNHGLAVKRAQQLSASSKQVHARVVPESGRGRLYYVVVGRAESRKEADKIRRSVAAPRGSYVTRLTF